MARARASLSDSALTVRTRVRGPERAWTRMRKLKIDWGELEIAFQTSSGGLVEMHHYLDLETG